MESSNSKERDFHKFIYDLMVILLPSLQFVLIRCLIPDPSIVHTGSGSSRDSKNKFTTLRYKYLLFLFLYFLLKSGRKDYYQERFRSWILSGHKASFQKNSGMSFWHFVFYTLPSDPNTGWTYLQVQKKKLFELTLLDMTRAKGCQFVSSVEVSRCHGNNGHLVWVSFLERFLNLLYVSY